MYKKKAGWEGIAHTPLSKEILNLGPKFAASATFEIGSPRMFGVMRSAIAENQATFMCYKLINTAFDGCNYFYSIVEGLKKDASWNPHNWSLKETIMT